MKMYFKTSLSDFSKRIGEELLKCCETKTKTNADRIRAMSDEELANFLNTCESMGYEDSSIATDSGGHCMDMLKWLKHPAE